MGERRKGYQTSQRQSNFRSSSSVFLRFCAENLFTAQLFKLARLTRKLRQKEKCIIQNSDLLLFLLLNPTLLAGGDQKPLLLGIVSPPTSECRATVLQTIVLYPCLKLWSEMPDETL